MKALIFDKCLSVVDAPMPVPGPGEALVRVLAAGICNTDIEIKRGYMQYGGILGHEFVGIVESAPSAHWVGKRVVGEINCPCGHCRFCKMEMPRHCLYRTVLGILNRPGAFAEYLTLPEENLHLAPSAIRDDVAVFTEPTAAAFRICEQLPIDADQRIIVLGDGKLAQLIAQTLWLYSKNVVCVGKHPWKLALLSALGITAVTADMEIEGNADIVIEATGHPSGLPAALSLVRPEGVVVLKSTCAQPLPLDSSQAVVNEIRLIGSRCGPFRPALEALALGTIEVRPLISESYALSDGVHAMTRAEDPGVMKVILHM